MQYLNSALSVTLLQSLLVIMGVAGLFYFQLSISAIIVFLLFYFLYSCVGVSVMMHRYWSHRSFEFRSPILKWLFTWFALVSCRGSILGWVYIHRLHHKFTDTEKDPHSPSYKGWRIFFPYLLKYDNNINKFIIKDFLNPVQLHLSKYFMIYTLVWAIVLGAVSPWLLYFAWILPSALTQIVVSSFLYFGHGRQKDINSSKNSSLFAFLFWGEGWHNNHHARPWRWNNSDRWWQIDMSAWLIRMVKK